MRRASSITALLLSCSLCAHATDSYDPATRLLTLRSVVAGNATFADVALFPGTRLSGPAGTAPDSPGDTFDPATGRLSLAAVAVAGKTLYNIVTTVTVVASIGRVSGADVYTGTELIAPSVQVKGGLLYHNVSLTVDGITSVSGGLPKVAQDLYDPSSHQLTIAALQFGNEVYTNAIVSVGAVVSVGGRGFAEAVLQSMTYAQGSGPTAALIQGTDGNFYGTSSVGGAGNSGTLFKVTAAGQLTVLHAFAAAGSGDAAEPFAGLVEGSDGNLYGTTEYGGAYNNGAVFRISTGGVESVLHSFAGNYSEPGHGLPGSTDGSTPFAALVEGHHGEFYGVTAYGGLYNAGTVYRISAAGEETELYSFTGGPSGIAGSTDAVAPMGALILGRDGSFYGTSQSGGAYNQGTVFKVTADGAETILHSFSGGVAGSLDGSGPFASLIEGSDGSLYGTTTSGGAYNEGTVFKMTTAGVETVLHSFSGGLDGLAGSKDGADPTSGLIRGSDGNFYGTTYGGGQDSVGSVYRMSPGGTVTVLYSFTGISTAEPGIGGLNVGDGVYPEGGLLEGRDGNLYGTTYGGGSASSAGTVFRLSNVIAGQ